MVLTKDQIFASVDLKLEKVDVPEWGGEVFVRSMTGKERDKFESSNMVKDRKSNTYDLRMENLRARLVVLTVCDETGKRIFDDGEAELIGARNASVLARLYDVGARLSGITKADIEEIAKNSTADTTDGSLSA